MVLNNITGLPVLREDGSLAGIVTEKNTLRLLCHPDETPGAVSDYMTTDVTSFSPDDSLSDIAACFMAHCFRRVPTSPTSKTKMSFSIRTVSSKSCIETAARPAKQEKMTSPDVRRPAFFCRPMSLPAIMEPLWFDRNGDCTSLEALPWDTGTEDSP